MGGVPTAFTHLRKESIVRHRSTVTNTAIVFCACLTVTSMLAACATGPSRTAVRTSEAQAASTSAADAPAPRPEPDPALSLVRMKPGTESLSDVFQRVLPSVVVILTEERKPSRERPGVEEVVNSIGTGFVISKDGLIMTASHVIEVVDRIIVRF